VCAGCWGRIWPGADPQPTGPADLPTKRLCTALAP
jgi:hypothetical protein